MGKREQVVASVIHEIQQEVSELESQSVRDSLGIYLERLSQRLADRLATQSSGFNREEFVQACRLAA